LRELRQVRWPNRKETWKMTLSVIVYVVILAVAIMLLDALLQLIFNQLLGGK
jgi:preprotein translocase SecE subunit